MSTPQDPLAIQSSLLLESVPEVRHAFGTLVQPIPYSVIPEKHWQECRPRWKQVHGTKLSQVESAQVECGECDALGTHHPSLPIGIVTADCVPILLAKKGGSSVAAIHAGWRGTYDRIVESTVMELEPEESQRSLWVAAIGPCALPCCYEVSVELAGQFRQRFGELATPQSPRHLDLPEINKGLLLGLGISEVDLVGECTICRKNSDGAFRFHSYRRDGAAAGRQFSCIEIASV